MINKIKIDLRVDDEVFLPFLASMRRSMSDDSLVSSRNSSIQAITVLQQPSEPNYMSLGRPQVSNEVDDHMNVTIFDNLHLSDT